MSRQQKKLLQTNSLDRAIGVFAPQRALKRAKARTALNFMAGPVSRKGASRKGSLSNWFVRRLNKYSEARERIEVVDRAEDLIANNPHAASIVDSTALSTVGGPGLLPQCKPAFKRLGITEEQAAEVADQAEWAFWQWSREADAEGCDHFADIQYMTVRRMVGGGEFVNLPVQLKDPGRTFSLALQVIDPRRLRTPHNLMSDKNIRDGIRLGPQGQRRSYFIADPDDGHLTTNLTSQHFREVPARRGHLPEIFHGFHRKDPEQIRGISALAPVIKLFRDYDDYMDFEVIGAILAASFPVFIETPPDEEPDEFTGDTSEAVSNTGASSQIKEYHPGQVVYGSENQKPHILKSDRPGNSFPTFVETLMRSMGAACGLPYEVVAKDFSKTNYSSARAALLEAWRLFQMYQTWLVNHFCQPVWEMVFEEAWLMGMIKLPSGAPDFYQARSLWTNATWTPPKRGHIDPVKEFASSKEGIVSNMLTLSDWYAEQGKDYEEELRQIAKERKLMTELGLTMADMPGFDLARMATQPEQ
jgi:lambda family phage portal protein